MKPHPLRLAERLHPLALAVVWLCVAGLAFAMSASLGVTMLWVSCLLFLGLLWLSRQQRLALQWQCDELLRNEAVLREQASHDPLTGLANRSLLMDRFNFTVERSKRNNIRFAMLMLDLNNFKSINDTYGHAAGDHVLAVQARRLLDCVRASDTVARLGGDEFVVLVESYGDKREVVHIGRKLIDCLTDPITLPDGSVVLSSASAGIALFPEHGTTFADLLNVADRGMYDCKTSGLMELQ